MRLTFPYIYIDLSIRPVGLSMAFMTFFRLRAAKESFDGVTSEYTIGTEVKKLRRQSKGTE